MHAIIVWLNSIARMVPAAKFGGKFYHDLKAAKDVQTLLFDKAKHTVETAVAWAEENGFKADKVDEGDEAATVIRLEQFAVTECAPDTHETMEIEDGISGEGCTRTAAPPPPAEEGQRSVGKGKRSLEELEAEGKDVGTITGYIKSIKGNRIGGWASHKSGDRQNEVVFPTAFKNVDAYMADNPIMLLFHDHNRLAIGKVVSLVVKDEGIEIEAELFEDDDDFKKIRTRVAAGVMMFSVGFLVPDGGRRDTSKEERAVYGESTVTAVDDAELLENSLVNIGANRRTLARLKALAVESAERDIDAANYHSVTKMLREMGSLAQKALDVSGKDDGQGAAKVDPAAAAEKIRGIVNEFVEKVASELNALAGGEPGDPDDEDDGDGTGDGNEPPPPPTEQALRSSMATLKSNADALLVVHNGRT